MAKIMKIFCGYNGQKINIQKSKLFVSSNIEHLITERLHESFEIPITKDLGMYLGMLIIHGRKYNVLFEFLVEKVRRKLSG